MFGVKVLLSAAMPMTMAAVADRFAILVDHDERQAAGRARRADADPACATGRCDVVRAIGHTPAIGSVCRTLRG